MVTISGSQKIRWVFPLGWITADHGSTVVTDSPGEDRAIASHSAAQAAIAAPAQSSRRRSGRRPGSVAAGISGWTVSTGPAGGSAGIAVETTTGFSDASSAPVKAPEILRNSGIYDPGGRSIRRSLGSLDAA